MVNKAQGRYERAEVRKHLFEEGRQEHFEAIMDLEEHEFRL